MFGKKRDKKFDKFDKKKRNRSRSPVNHLNRNKRKPNNLNLHNNQDNGQPKRFFNNNQQRNNQPNHFSNFKKFQQQPPFQPGVDQSTMPQMQQFNQEPQVPNQMLNNMYNQDQFNQSLGRPPLPDLNQIGNECNELEIIVTNREQWRYAEMLESKFRNETSLKYIDLVFPHSEDMILDTLKKLYEKKTLYAVVVNALNENSNTFTLHILHNQTEFSNVTINEGIQLICQDYVKEITNPQSPYFRAKAAEQQQPTNSLATAAASFANSQINSNHLTNHNQIQQQQTHKPLPSSEQQQQTVNKLPNNIAYILKMTLDDNTAQFLSISQIDSVIDFYSSEKDKLLSKSLKPEFNSTLVSSTYNNNLNNNLESDPRLSQQHQQQQTQLNTAINSSLLDDPQIKAALNQLMGLRAPLNSSAVDNNTQQQLNDPNDISNTTNNYASSLSYNSSQTNNNAFNNLDLQAQLSQMHPQHQGGSNFNQMQMNKQNRANFFGKDFRNAKNEFRTRQSRFT